MPDDEQDLREINLKIAEAENNGDRDWLASHLASRLAFLRANKKFDDQLAFLQEVKLDDPRKDRETDPKSIKIKVHGNRAIVTCIVTMTVEGKKKKFHNLRLFIKQDGQWKLLGWANEAYPYK